MTVWERHGGGETARTTNIHLSLWGGDIEDGPARMDDVIPYDFP